VAFQASGYQTCYIGKYMNFYKQIMKPYVPPGWTRFVHETMLGSSDTAPSTGVETEPLDSFLLYHYGEHALRFIEENAASPFLLMLNPTEPHFPATPAPGDEQLFSDFVYRERAYFESDLSDKPSIIQERASDYITSLPGITSIADEDEFHRNMLRSSVAVDRVVGDLVNKITQLGLLQRTVFIFLSDNGFMWGEHKMFAKGLPYEESIRVPLVIVVPGLQSHEDDHLVIANLDLPATLFDLAQIPAPSDGSSLLPLLQNAELDWRAEVPIEFFNDVYVWAGLRTDDWKYVEWGNGELELYDLVDDPYEQSSLHENPAYADVLENLKSRRAHYERGLTFREPLYHAIPPARAGEPYRYALRSWGGQLPYSFRLVWGELPSGLVLEAQAGVLSGVPRKAGTNPENAFGILVTDSSITRYAGRPQTHEKELRLWVRTGGDTDGDGFVNGEDNCLFVPNPDQLDTDGDWFGDACECGDFNGDGRVNTTDARLIQRCTIGEIPCSGLCDATGDGICNTADARLIQRYAVRQLAKENLSCAERRSGP
jgi:arylsulfatase A-like enzyme